MLENNQKRKDLSIIIVPHNSREFLRVTLESVYNSRTSNDFEVIVHDNGSTDGTVEMVEEDFPKVKLIKGENIGFSAGNNEAIKWSAGRYILLLNPDTKISPDTLQIMIDFMDSHPDAGISTCKLVLGNGKIDPACRRSFPTPWVAISRLSGLSLLFPKSRLFNKYNMHYLSEDEQYEIDSCSGAFMLIRRFTIDQIGLLDEDFFMYNEDVDWCYRAKKAGWKVYYYPKTEVVHYKKRSAKFSKKAQWEFHRSMILFHQKHFAKKYPWFINQVAYLGPRIRYVLKYVWSIFKGFGFHSKEKTKRYF